MSERIVIYSQVGKVEERFVQLYRSGVGADAVFEKASQGWFLHLRGSYEALYVGTTEPVDLKVNDLVKITIERVDPNERLRPDNGRPNINNEGARISHSQAPSTSSGKNVD